MTGFSSIRLALLVALGAGGCSLVAPSRDELSGGKKSRFERVPDTGAAGGDDGGSSEAEGGGTIDATDGAADVGADAGETGADGPMTVLDCGGLGAVGKWDAIAPDVILTCPPDQFQCGGNGTQAFVLDPLKAGTIYLGTFKQGLWKSTDCGTTWKQLNTGTNSTTMSGGVQSMFEIDPVDPRVMYTKGTSNAGFDQTMAAPIGTNFGRRTTRFCRRSSSTTGWCREHRSDRSSASDRDVRGQLRGALRWRLLRGEQRRRRDLDHDEGPGGMEGGSRIAHLDRRRDELGLLRAQWSLAERRSGRDLEAARRRVAAGCKRQAPSRRRWVFLSRLARASCGVAMAWSGRSTKSGSGHGRCGERRPLALPFDRWCGLRLGEGPRRLLHVSSQRRDNIWSKMAAPGMTQGEMDIAVDRQHHVLYSSNSKQGFWRVVTQ